MYNKRTEILNPIDSEEELILQYTSLNHECVSQPFLSYVKGEMGWTSLQFSAICYLKRHNVLSMSELADMMMITRQQATQLVASLVKRGHVVREQDPDNRRMVYIRPTEMAVKGLLQVEHTFIQAIQSALDAKPAEQRRAITDSMRTLIDLFLTTDEVGCSTMVPVYTPD